MKIALLTIWHEKNYGAELQAYATIKFLKSLSHDVKMIDVRLSDKDSKSIKFHIINVIESIGPCNRKFKKFWNHHIPTTQRYKSLIQLQNNPPIADLYIVGSDQVWNPDITKTFQEIYFLNFGGPHIKRISYASSFGQTDINYENPKIVHKLLSCFNNISCREYSGVCS